MNDTSSKYSYFSKDKCILVTGGCGFIGGNLIRKILQFGDSKVINIDKLTYASDFSSINSIINNLSEDSKKRYHFYQCDLYDKNKVLKIILDTKPNYIYHLAAESHVDRSINDPISFIKSNIIGTYNLIEATRHYYQDLSSQKENF